MGLIMPKRWIAVERLESEISSLEYDLELACMNDMSHEINALTDEVEDLKSEIGRLLGW